MDASSTSMDASSASRRLGRGTFEPSESSAVGDVNVLESTVPATTTTTEGSVLSMRSADSQPFFDAHSDIVEEGGNAKHNATELAGTATTASSSSAATTSMNKNYPRRPSDVGSIPLKTYSLEIINGLSPGQSIPELDQSKKYQTTRTSDPDGQDKDNALLDFLKDDPRDMTNGRRIALWMMKRFAWYNPQLSESDKGGATDEIIDGGRYRTQDGYPISHSKEEKPSLEKAWAYFDHVALPRYLFVEKENPNEQKGFLTRIVRKFSKANKQLQRAEPGEAEKPTRLYSPLWTPHNQLGDFGLGIGLYFSTIRALTVLVVLVGMIHIPNIMYYQGPDYSDGQEKVNMLLKGSAVCTDTRWVACPTCPEEEFHTGQSWLQYNNMTFARKNLCEGATLQQGMVNFAGLIYVVLATLLLNYYLRRMEVKFDEDEQTAQDYSIVINNPPPDATDPEEWHYFFKKAFDAQVTACTTAVDNDLLVQTLVERREKMRMLELMVEPGTKLDIVTLAGIAAAKERERNALQSIIAMFVPGIPEIFSRMAVLTAKVQGLAQQDYPVTNVFITFETEADQRKVLENLTVGQAAIDANRKSSVRNLQYLFRGFRVLAVHEPEEPDSIRWDDLNISFKDRMKQQSFTALATVAALVVVTIVVFVVNDWNSIFTAYTIAVTNAVFPLFAKFLTYNEAHPSYGSLQTSLYFKIAVFRWVTTAIIITIITPFDDTLYNGPGGLIFQIQAQFVAEITTTAGLQLTDPFGHIQRHFLAPRAATQDAMNLSMQGSKFELAERYTAVAKLLFLTFWYCAIYPGAFFFCAFSLQVIYYLDKLSLTRTWKRVPRLGSTISQFNRTYFLPLSILAMAIFSSYYWSGFPFDNLCENEEEQVSALYVGNHSVPVEAKKTIVDVVISNATAPIIEKYIPVTIDEGESTYRYCLQDYLRTRGRQTYPFVPQFQAKGEQWMTEEQETVTSIYGWASFGFFLGFCAIIISTWIYSFCSYFKGHYSPTGDDQGQNFSELDSKNIYIPQVDSPYFSYPLLACNVDDIDKDMLDWTDHEHPHEFYDLTKDANALIRGIDISGKVVFSQVAHWPPDKADD